MPYSDGNKPQVGDRVRHFKGDLGCVTQVQLNAANVPGEDIIAVKWDDGSVGVGMSLAREYVLLSRALR